MNTTVRSVRVELEMSIDRYVANARTAGRETDAAFDRAEAKIVATDKAVGKLETSTDELARTTAQARINQSTLGREIGQTGTAADGAAGKTKRYTLEMAIADEKASRLRKSLREQAAASLDAGRGLAQVGQSAGRAESSIDKYSGRLKTILGLIQILGPAALRLGAGALPAVSAGLVGLGAAAGGIGVTIAALSGIGDALKALDKYDTDRSAASLQAVRLELEKLGPDGAHFVQVLRNLGPELHNLQLLARAGVLPGFEDFIDSAITRLPIVEQIVNRLSKEVGRLATDAGEALAGDEWTPFFEYVRSQAAPILDDFARSTGNVALGLANLLVAFDPLTQRFTGGLEEMTSAFADWSSELEDNEGFQSFLDTVEDAGPELLDFLGSTIDLLAGLVRASAPLGAVTVPILTAIVKAFAAIANSPIGPPLYTAAAAMLAFSRASALAEKSAARFSSTVKGLSRGGLIAGGIGGLALLASSLTDVDDKAGLANTTMLASAGLIAGGAWGAAIGAGIGVAADFAAAQGDLNDELERTREIAATGSLKEQQAEYERLSKEIDDTSFSLGRFLFGTEAQEQALAELEDSMSSTDALTALFGRDMGLTADQMAIAADSAGAFSDALADLNGWFDKRDAVRGYRDAIDELRESLKDGFSREDAANVDALGRSILQVANNIKSPRVRNNFLEGAREQLEDLAEHAGPKAEAAIERLIRKFDDEGLTHPKPIEPTVDDRRAEQGVEDLKRKFKTASQIIENQKTEPTIDADANPFLAMRRQVSGDLGRLDKTTATPKVSVDPGNSFSVLGGIRSELARIVSKTITVTTKRIGGALEGFGIASGGTVPGPRTPYGDKVHAMLAPGEEVISNRHGQADRFRADRAAGRIAAYADGGRVGGGLNDPLFDGEGPRYYRAAYRHNRPFALDGPSRWKWPYQSELTPAQARAFEAWVDGMGVPFDPSARITDYDMRGYWAKTRGRGWEPGDHFPDTWKTPYDTTFSHESKYATSDNPFYWRGDKLVDTRTGQVVFAGADGATVPGARFPYGDRTLALTAPGEEIVSNRYGQADRHRGLLKAISANRLADGGTVEDRIASTYTTRRGRGGDGYEPFLAINEAAHALHDAAGDATKGLKGLEKQARKLEKAEDRVQAKRDALQSRYDQVFSTTTNLLKSDIFAESEEPANPWAAGAKPGGLVDPIGALSSDIADAQAYDALVELLKKRGLSQDAIEEVASKGLPALQLVAGYSDSDLQRFQSLYTQRDQLVGVAAADTAQAVVGRELGAANKHLERIEDRLHDVESAIKQANKDNTNGQKDQSAYFVAGVNGAAAAGHGRGNR